jgi:NTE family protein
MHLRISNLLDTLTSARDNTVLDAHRDRVIRLPVAGYGTTEFDMSDERILALYNAGVAATTKWLADHPGA